MSEGQGVSEGNPPKAFHILSSPSTSSRFNIADLQNKTLSELKEFLLLYRNNTTKATQLIDRIMRPLVDRVETINDLGLGYITLSR